MKAKILLILVLLLITLTGCSSEPEDTRMQQVFEHYNETQDYESTAKLIEELYPDDQTMQDLMKENIYKEAYGEEAYNKAVSEASSDILSVESYDYTIDGNYCYIKGRVKNNGDTPIEYFEVTAEYLDAVGNVLDSDYTNSGQTLNGGDMKEFEIMHPYSGEYISVNVYINTYQ